MVLVVEVRSYRVHTRRSLPDPTTSPWICSPTCCCSALLVFTAVPWSLCALLFSGLHFTYPRDRDRAAKLAAAAAEAEAEAAKLMPTGADGKPAALELVAVGSADGLSEGNLTQEDKAAPLGSTTDGGRRSSGSVTEYSRGA